MKMTAPKTAASANLREEGNASHLKRETISKRIVMPIAVLILAVATDDLVLLDYVHVFR